MPEAYLSPRRRRGTEATLGTFRRWRHEPLGPQVHRGGAIHLVAVDDDAGQERTAGNLPLALRDEFILVLIGERGKRLVAQRKRIVHRLDELGLGLELDLEVA